MALCRFRSIAVTVAVTCTVLATIPPGFEPLWEPVQRWRPRHRLDGAAVAIYTATSSVGRNLELIPDAYLIEVDDLRTALYGGLFPIRRHKRHCALGGIDSRYVGSYFVGLHEDPARHTLLIGGNRGCLACWLGGFAGR